METDTAAGGSSVIICVYRIREEETPFRKQIKVHQLESLKVGLLAWLVHRNAKSIYQFGETFAQVSDSLKTVFQ